MNSLTLKPIPRYFSIYLDLLRFGAAMMVLLFHIMLLDIGPDYLMRLIPARGNDFVILFFVLSGYVISATVDRKKEQSLRDYALDRMARVYSVAIPALLLSLFLVIVLQQPAVEYTKILYNFFFLGQTGFIYLNPLHNAPYWSLCYEVMYYILFGCFVFLDGKKRLISLLIFGLIAGPKVLVSMPCWLLGVLIYHLRDKINLKLPQAIFVAIIIPVMLALLCHEINFDQRVTEFSKSLLGKYYDYLFHSGDFLIDYAKAVIIAIHLYGMGFIAINWPKLLESFITKAAAMSFTLYLMHNIFVMLIFNNIPRDSRGLLVFGLAAAGIPLLCYFVSLFTEARRPQLRKYLDNWLPYKNW
jgi:peptidoglycan/LPS O-acetylase OafA/YrhL